MPTHVINDLVDTAKLEQEIVHPRPSLVAAPPSMESVQQQLRERIRNLRTQVNEAIAELERLTG